MLEYIYSYGSDTYDIHIFITDEDDFDKICNLLRFKQIEFALDKNVEDILEDIEGFKNEDIEIRDLKFFRIVTVITYG